MQQIMQIRLPIPLRIGIESQIHPRQFAREPLAAFIARRVWAVSDTGKTNVAMLTVAREIGQHIYNGVLHKEDFKIIYVAPMKALAAEVVEKFGSRLGKLGITVKELTGDMQLTKQELTNTQVCAGRRVGLRPDSCGGAEQSTRVPPGSKSLQSLGSIASLRSSSPRPRNGT